MKRFTLILPPVILFAIFAFFYQGHLKEMEAQRVKIVEEQRIATAKEDQRKAELKAQADAEAAKAKKDREAADQKRREDEQNKKDEKERTITTATEAALAENSGLQAQIIKLQKDLQETRIQRDAAQKEAIETKLDIEKARIDKRNAELEIQRYTDMLAQRIKQSSLLAQQPDVAKK